MRVQAKALEGKSFLLLAAETDEECRMLEILDPPGRLTHPGVKIALTGELCADENFYSYIRFEIP